MTAPRAKRRTAPFRTLEELGAEMLQFHGGMGDPIYAVGSYYYSGKRHPSRAVEVAADQALTKMYDYPDPSWTKKDKAGLWRAIITMARLLEFDPASRPRRDPASGGASIEEKVQEFLELRRVVDDAKARDRRENTVASFRAYERALEAFHASQSSRDPAFGGASRQLKGPHWYRWLVNYRDRNGRIQQETVEATTHREALVAGQHVHPTGSDFTAIKFSTKPLRP